MLIGPVGRAHADLEGEREDHQTAWHARSGDLCDSGRANRDHGGCFIRLRSALSGEMVGE